MSKTITSGNVTFVDLSDNRRLEVYITSNLPTTQIYNQNEKTYTPDWGTTNLQLSADVYLDSKEVTSNTYVSITWYKKVDTQAKTQVGTGSQLTINSNQLSSSIGIITYICEATYNDTTTNPPTAHAEIVFTRVDTGINGSNGQDGTSVTILGSYNTLEELQTAHPNGNAGDAYIIGGRLYVWAVDDSQWENVGNIQGPAGKDGKNAKSIILNGESQVFKVSKNNVMTPTTIKVTAYTFNTTVTNWTYSINGGQTFLSTAPTGVVRNGNIITITGSTITSNSIAIKASDGEVEDVFTVYKAVDGIDGGKGDDGAPAPIAFLTNENVTFSANSQGQIATTTITSNVVAYNGTTKVTPAIGTITGVPTGMTVTPNTITASNEIMLTITIANNTTLGSASNNMGVISIPITYPVSTVLYLTWSKVNSGMAGVGVRSTTVSYGVSDSAAVKPADNTWQSTIPTVEDGKYLWTRTIIDYTDDAITDTITYTYAKQGTKGDTGSTGSSVVVSSIQYQEGASSTITPTGTWSNSVVAVAEGKYLWTKTVFSDGKIAYGVAKQGVSGKDGVGINSITVDYGVSDSATVKPTAWQQDIPTVADGKYLWTRTITDYTDTSKADTVAYVYAKQGTKGDTGSSGTSVTVKSIKYQSGTSATTAPTGTWSDSVVAVSEGNYLWTQTTFSDNKIAYGVAKQGQKGEVGRGISKIAEYYLATTAASGVTTSTSGWTTTVQTIDATKKYLWNYELITYTDNTTSATTPVIIGVFGNTGAAGKGISSVAERYLATASSSGVTTSTSGWTPEIQTLTATKKYLWNYEIITYTDGTTSTINPIIIGAYGDKGDKGDTGNAGRGVSSIIEQYYQSTSATSQVDGSWSTTVPTWADGKYIWTRSVITYTDSTTSTTSPVCITGQKGGTGGIGATGVGVSSVDVWYYQSTSSTALNGGSWVTTAPIWSDGKYVWTKTITTYTNNTTDETVAVCITGQKGSTGVGVKSVTEYYLATSESSGVTTSTSGWTTTIQTITLDKKYLWNYEIITYTDNKTSTTVPVIIGVYGNTGKGIKSVTEYYLATASSSSITTSTSGWTTTMQTLTATKKYLWNYELITYTDNTTATINPVIIGVYGDQGVAAVSFQVYAPNGYLLTKELESLTLQTFACEGSTAITSGATYQWSQLIDEVWTVIEGATSTTYTVTQADVLKAKSYRCVMTYKSQTYTSTVTVQDKTDMYNSIMCISSNATNNDCYWVLYTLVYSDAEEVDPLLGPISINAPSSPISGDYWYAVDATNATVALKKYNGTSWADSTDKQSLFYYWDMINDGSAQIPLGDSAKVKVISCHDFTSTATLVCEVSSLEDGLLTQSSLSLTDASDPIVSDTEPTATVNGQIWIKPNDNGTYLMFIWDESVSGWISNDMDTRSKVYTSRPSSYNAGDLWITASDTDHGSYLQGTLLQAQAYNTTYNAADWSPTLRYDKDLDNMKETLNNLSQYVTITSLGLRIAARDSSGNLSPFTSLFTSTALTFYQGSDKLLTLANNQLTAPKIVVENELEVQGEIRLGDLKLIIESNGSFSFAIEK